MLWLSNQEDPMELFYSDLDEHHKYDIVGWKVVWSRSKKVALAFYPQSGEFSYKQ